jgi:hypothetical protein
MNKLCVNAVAMLRSGRIVSAGVATQPVIHPIRRSFPGGPIAGSANRFGRRPSNFLLSGIFWRDFGGGVE